MEIILTNEEVKELMEVLDSQLSWMVCDSGCADEYKKEIKVFINLLRAIKCQAMSDDYENWFNEFMDNM